MLLFRASILVTLLCSSVFAQIGNPSSKAGEPDSGIPIFDPSGETISFMGQTFSLKDNRIGLHFESYLASEAYKAQDAQEYKRDIENIQKVLQPASSYKNKVATAYRMLKNAARYEGDHNVSESLGAAVVSAVDAINTIKKRDQQTAALRTERSKVYKKLDFVATRTDMNARRTVGEKQKTTRKKSIEYITLRKRLLEIELLIKKNQTVGIVKLAQSKVNFQSILIQLFVQRRFEHVVMGCRFYINIFEPTDSKLAIKRGSSVDKFFKQSVGISPTIAGLESLSNEIIGKVRTLVNMAENHIIRGELHSASNRLMEAYAVGEHLTYIQMLPLEKKQKLYDYAKVSNNLLDSIDARDFICAKTFNDELKTMASDYRHTKVDAYISSFTTASNAHAVNAFIHMSQNEKDEMFQEIENARILWPNNPKLDEISSILEDKLTDVKTGHLDQQKLAEQFDQLMIEQRHMAILKKENRNAFLTQFNIANDEERLSKMREIADKYEPVIRGLQKCEEISKDNFPNRAWETCYQLKQKYPDIKEIDTLLSEYRIKASKFVSLLDKAKRHIDSENYGSALSCYLKAKTIHPKSGKVNTGIKLMLDIYHQ